MTPLLAICVTASLLLAFGLLAIVRRRSASRHRTMAGLLDAADHLEDRLRDARAEIEAIAGDADDPVRDAMQDMLRQRLWLQQHGAAASLTELRRVRDSILAASLRIDRQLQQVERARAPLA